MSRLPTRLVGIVLLETAYELDALNLCDCETRLAWPDFQPVSQQQFVDGPVEDRVDGNRERRPKTAENRNRHYQRHDVGVFSIRSIIAAPPYPANEHRMKCALAIKGHFAAADFE